MCQLGRSGTKVHEIPKEKAVTAYKVVTVYDGQFQPLVFGTAFERLKKGDRLHSFTTHYHHGGTFRTEPPDVFPGDNLGNGRGFWTWGKKEYTKGGMGYNERVVYEVRVWGRVVKHRYGYRAEYIKFVRRLK